VRAVAYAPGVELELDPAQPSDVARAVGELLRASGDPADPWWQAGLDELLEPAGPDGF
jgi:hypothetical protein